MQALVIYDNTGNVHHITYGDAIQPETLSSARVDIPTGCQLTGVEINDAGEVVPKFESMPKSDADEIIRLVKTETDPIKEELYGAMMLSESSQDNQAELNLDFDYRLSLIELGLN